MNASIQRQFSSLQFFPHKLHAYKLQLLEPLTGQMSHASVSVCFCVFVIVIVKDIWIQIGAYAMLTQSQTLQARACIRDHTVLLTPACFLPEERFEQLSTAVTYCMYYSCISFYISRRNGRLRLSQSACSRPDWTAVLSRLLNEQLIAQLRTCHIATGLTINETFFGPSSYLTEQSSFFTSFSSCLKPF